MLDGEDSGGGLGGGGRGVGAGQGGVGRGGAGRGGLGGGVAAQGKVRVHGGVTAVSRQQRSDSQRLVRRSVRAARAFGIVAASVCLGKGLRAPSRFSSAPAGTSRQPEEKAAMLQTPRRRSSPTGQRRERRPRQLPQQRVRQQLPLSSGWQLAQCTPAGANLDTSGTRGLPTATCCAPSVGACT